VKKTALLAIFVLAAGAWAQTDGVFTGTCQNGKSVHMVPTTDALERHFGRRPSLAQPSSTATVYPPSYGFGNLIAHGRPEISNAGFQAIYWNSSVATSTSTSNGYATIQGQTDAFIQAFADNQNWDNSSTDDYTIIQQYGTGSPIAPTLSLNQANPSGGAFIDGQTPVATITDSQIQTYLAGLLNAGKLRVNSNTIYGVFFPAGTSVQLSGIASCTDFCAYHGGFTYGGSTIFYAAFPYPNCGGCNPYNYAAADMLTMLIGHETREAVTDAYGAWYDIGGYEADDKCAWSNLYRTANGNFLVQPEYSNGGTVTASGFTATYPGPGCIVPSSSCTAPPAPTGLTATAGNAQALLSWAAASGASSYNVKRSTTTGAEVTIASAATNSFTDTGLTNGTTYYYVVSALATCGAHPESGNSNQASAKPSLPSQPDFTISASPSSGTVTQGGQTTYTVTTGALSGFSGTVALNISGLPSGVTASFNPSSITGSGTSTLTLTASASASTGTVTLTIAGASGSLAHSATPTLTVTGAGPAPDFAIAASPASRSIPLGNSTTYAVTVSPLNGFTGTVDLSVSGVPTGSRAILKPTSISSGASALTITAGQSTVRGTYRLAIKGTNGGLRHTTLVTLIIH
jgi:hypothetical protein